MSVTFDQGFLPYLIGDYAKVSTGVPPQSLNLGGIIPVSLSQVCKMYWLAKSFDYHFDLSGTTSTTTIYDDGSSSTSDEVTTLAGGATFKINSQAGYPGPAQPSNPAQRTVSGEYGDASFYVFGNPIYDGDFFYTDIGVVQTSRLASGPWSGKLTLLAHGITEATVSGQSGMTTATPAPTMAVPTPPTFPVFVAYDKSTKKYYIAPVVASETSGSLFLTTAAYIGLDSTGALVPYKKSDATLNIMVDGLALPSIPLYISPDYVPVITPGGFGYHIISTLTGSITVNFNSFWTS